jgi:hypothetical protein
MKNKSVRTKHYLSQPNQYQVRVRLCAASTKTYVYSPLMSRDMRKTTPRTSTNDLQHHPSTPLSTITAKIPDALCNADNSHTLSTKTSITVARGEKKPNVKEISHSQHTHPFLPNPRSHI